MDRLRWVGHVMKINDYDPLTKKKTMIAKPVGQKMKSETENEVHGQNRGQPEDSRRRGCKKIVY